MKFKMLIVALISMFSIGCSNKNKTLTENPISTNMVEKRALEWLVSDVSITYNEDNSMALMVKKPAMDPRNPMPTIRAIVYDIASDTAMYDKSIPKGSIKWADNDHVYIVSIPGTVQQGKEDEDPGYYIHVKTNQRKKSL